MNFESPGAFFGRLTERRWALVTARQGQGATALFLFRFYEAAARVGRLLAFKPARLSPSAPAVPATHAWTAAPFFSGLLGAVRVSPTL